MQAIQPPGADRWPPLPITMRTLPRDERGYPVPWFVAKKADGQVDIRIADERRKVQAIREDRCWVCGRRYKRPATFVIGPMCAVNRTTSEPPCHRECAEFSAQACPFLTTPRRKRNEKDLPDACEAGPGIPIMRNPGAVLLWETGRWEILRVPNGILFRLGDPLWHAWYVEGRPARREEIEQSIETGLPLLLELAQAQSPEAVEQLYRQRELMDHLLPA